MKSYLAVLSARFRALLQYRAAAGFGTQLFWGLIRVMIFGAFYYSTTAEQPMTLAEVVSYIWLGQAMFALLPWRTDSDVRDMIRSGTVAYELARPVDLYFFWFARAVAARTAPVLLRAVPMLLVAGLFLGLQPPASWASGGACLVSTLGAVALASAISAIITISLLWTVSGLGIQILVSGAVMFLSGMIVPLPLFPDWAQTTLNLLPFRGLIDVPFRLYLGHLPPEAFWGVFGQQCLWTVILVGLGRGLLGRGLRRVVVQGG